MPVQHFGPGSHMPLWVDLLDRAAFGEVWGALEDQEHAWAIQGLAFARWKAVPAIGEADLLRIAVLPEARGCGVGRDLLRACTEALKGMGIDTLHLEVRVSNTPARRLYAAEGWTEDGLRSGYYRDGEDAALYSRHL